MHNVYQNYKYQRIILYETFNNLSSDRIIKRTENLFLFPVNKVSIWWLRGLSPNPVVQLLSEVFCLNSLQT